jgi:hypothetical protein
MRWEKDGAGCRRALSIHMSRRLMLTSHSSWGEFSASSASSDADDKLYRSGVRGPPSEGLDVPDIQWNNKVPLVCVNGTAFGHGRRPEYFRAVFRRRRRTIPIRFGRCTGDENFFHSKKHGMKMSPQWVKSSVTMGHGTAQAADAPLIMMVKHRPLNAMDRPLHPDCPSFLWQYPVAIPGKMLPLQITRGSPFC